MSDVLIKGAKMPKTCGYCFFNDFNICQIEHFPVADAVYHEERHESCPLVEIPSHGRLIDADVIEVSKILKTADEQEKQGFIQTAKVLRELVNND